MGILRQKGLFVTPVSETPSPWDALLAPSWQPCTELQSLLYRGMRWIAPQIIAAESDELASARSPDVDTLDWTQPAPVFTHVDEANECIATLWQALSERLRNPQTLSAEAAHDSRNSSRPPSHDTILSKAQRHAAHHAAPSGKPQGAQPGHTGHGRALLPTSEVDTVLVCQAPSHCPDCNTVLTAGTLAQRKQVSYLQDKRLSVTEYQIQKARCTPCQRTHRGTLPDGTPIGAFGACVHGVISLLTGRYHLSKRGVSRCLNDLFGLSISPGTVSAGEHTVSQALATVADEVHEAVKTAPVVHADETPFYHQHQLKWLWVVATDRYAYLSVQKRRTLATAEWVLGGISQSARFCVTDRYASYGFIPKNQRQYCWAHLKRDIKAVCDSPEPSVAALGEALESARVSLFDAVRTYETADTYAQSIERTVIAQALKAFRLALREGIQLTGTKAAGFCRNLIRDWRSLWRFLHHPSVPHTNNHGERILRGPVLWRKVSLGTQSLRGDLYVERISTVGITCHLQARPLLPVLIEAVAAWWQKTPPPSLLLDSG